MYTTMLLLLFVLFIVIRVADDFYLVKSGKQPKHWLNAILTCIAATGLSLLDNRPMYFTLPVFLFTYQYLFDAGLNVLRKLPVYYIGQTATLDRFQRWILGNDEDKFGMLFAMKTLLFTGVVGAYFLNY